MPPAVGRFAPQHLSNPFTHLNQHAAIHQNSHLPQPNLQQAQAMGNHPTFAAGNPNIFAPSAGNANMQGGFAGGGGLGGGGGTGLASHAAQMGFAHGAALQQQQAHDAASSVSGTATKGLGSRVREVWKTNLAQEMQVLRSLVDKYPYISMDTEFPGVVVRPMGEFLSKASYHYQTVRCNVDLLKIIQLGITLFSAEGETPPAQADPSSLQRPGYPSNLVMCPCTWSFNFQFSTDDDMCNEDSILMLKKAGVDFDKHAELGIDPAEFGSLLITSGLTLSEDVNWISFHSGYDFAYLVKLMWCQQLPADEESYRRLVEIFFPRLLDVKYLLRHAQSLARRNALPNTAAAAAVLNNLGTKSGLQDLADELGCQRVGNQHQAGSDAWLTGMVFWAMRAKVFDGRIPDEMNGQMWGLTGVGAPASAAAQQAVLAAQGGGHGVNGSGVSAMGTSAMGFHTGGTPNTHREAGPGTPTSHAAGLAPATPGPQGQGQGQGQGQMGGMMTPGGGGVFGNFQYGK